MRANLGGRTATPTRGIESDLPDIAPLAQGLVIGLGGSGIQTISRVKSMVESQFPEASATSMLRFLGIDAVTLGQQVPPLPVGVSLQGSEFYNLTEIPFEPAAIVKADSVWASPLARWWDHGRRVPAGFLTDGMKQDRMIGRLAYYRGASTLEAKIAQGLRGTAQLTAENVENGAASGGAGAARPKVYIVSSMCGGTGSSGLLETVYRVWGAAAGIGISPEIQLFLYMPGVFEDAVSRSSTNPGLETEHLRANAYGFLRELDHFIVHSDTLYEHLATPASQKVSIGAGDLVKQVYLVDSQLSTGQFLRSVTDAYDTTATVLYQKLMTRVGQQMVINGTNTDTLLEDTDRHGRRRIYCGLGVSCITYPGETLRQHLSNRFANWLISDLMLTETPDMGELVRRDGETGNLLGIITGLHQEATQFELDDYVKSYHSRCQRAPETLQEDSSDQTVSATIADITLNSARAVSELNAQLAARKLMALSRLDDAVVGHLMSQGRSLPYLAQMLKRVSAQVEEEKYQAERTRLSQQSTIATCGDEIGPAREALADRNPLKNWFGGRARLARKLGDDLRAYGTAEIQQARTTASVDFYQEVLSAIEELRRQLDQAVLTLHGQAQRFSRAWHADELIGKDAGPRDLTALIPADVHPEVEDSEFAKQAFNEMLTAVTQVDSTELLSELYRTWRSRPGSRAALDLGSRSEDKSGNALRVLVGQLEELADRYALQLSIPTETVDGVSNDHLLYLPRSLEAASERVDHGQSLQRALTSLSALAKSPLLPVDQTKLPADRPISPSVVIARPRGLAAAYETLMPTGSGIQVVDWADQERILGVTTVWGVSAHSLVSVANWRGAYDRSLVVDKDGNRRSPHLARGLETYLEPVEPQYNDFEMAAEVVVQALLGTRLLRDSDLVAQVFGPDADSEAVGIPLETVDGQWKCETSYRTDNGYWRAHPYAAWLGSTLEELLNGISSNARYRQLNSDFVADLQRQVDLSTKISVLETIVAWAETCRDASQGAPKERQAAEQVREAALEELNSSKRRLLAEQISQGI